MQCAAIYLHLVSYYLEAVQIAVCSNVNKYILMQVVQHGMSHLCYEHDIRLSGTVVDPHHVVQQKVEISTTG